MVTSFVVGGGLPKRPWLGRTFETRLPDAGLGFNRMSAAHCPPPRAVAAAAPLPLAATATSTATMNDLSHCNLSPPDITVVSFNVLADLYVARCMDGAMFGHCAPTHLNPNYRQRLVLDELLRYSGDILCLQEVEWWSFEHYLEPHLRAFGFRGRHDAKHGQSVEGCATFYRTTVFSEVCCERVSMRNAARDSEYADLFDPYLDAKETAAVFRRITTCAQFTLLASKCIKPGQPARHVLVINTHLFYHPDAPHVRNVTVAVLLRAAQRILAKFSPFASVVMCGDFNSYPDTGVVEYLLTGRLGAAHRDWNAATTFRWGNNNKKSKAVGGGQTEKQPKVIVAGEGSLELPWWKRDSVGFDRNGHASSTGGTGAAGSGQMARNDSSSAETHGKRLPEHPFNFVASTTPTFHFVCFVLFLFLSCFVLFCFVYSFFSFFLMVGSPTPVNAPLGEVASYLMHADVWLLHIPMTHNNNAGFARPRHNVNDVHQLHPTVSGHARLCNGRPRVAGPRKQTSASDSVVGRRWCAALPQVRHAIPSAFR